MRKKLFLYLLWAAFFFAFGSALLSIVEIYDDSGLLPVLPWMDEPSGLFSADPHRIFNFIAWSWLRVSFNIWSLLGFYMLGWLVLHYKLFPPKKKKKRSPLEAPEGFDPSGTKPQSEKQPAAPVNAEPTQRQPVGDVVDFRQGGASDDLPDHLKDIMDKPPERG